MEKTVTIDGVKVRMKSTAGVPKRYKAQFGRDFFRDLMKLQLLEAVLDLNSDVDENDLKSGMHLLGDIAWTLAKTADKTIADPIDWLDDFELFAIFNEMRDILELLINNVKQEVQKKTNHPARSR